MVECSTKEIGEAIMKVSLGALVFALGACFAAQAEETLERAKQMEMAGDGAGARALLARAAQSSTDPAVLLDYAEFLDRYGDPGARNAYRKVLGGTTGAGNREARAKIARRLVVLDLIAGDRAAAARSAEAYVAATGKPLALPSLAAESAAETSTITIPGPLRSFARMAAISSDLGTADILPALARNVVTNGYQASHSNDALEQTEYLKLVHRYLSQARELDKLAGASKMIKIETCEAPNAAELLRILGYRMRGGCGSEVVLETVNATRAFLTTDSGFPLAELEEALRTNRPFEYDFHPVSVPVLYSAEYWMGGSREKEGEFIDMFLSDPSLCRLYLGLSKMDRSTALALKEAMPVQRIKAFSHVLDFFGGMFEIRNGKAVAPGGERSAAAWAELVGASPDQGPAFFEKLIAKDDGWLASLFDALSRVSGPVRDYLVDPARMKRFYAAVRGRVTSPGPARPVFRSNADMMLLTTRLQMVNGKPHIPGNLEVWRNLFINHPHGKYDGKLTRLAGSWKEPDDVLEALFALCRKAVENEPLKIFMALSDIDRNRETPLEPATVDRLARSYRHYGAQYAIFNDAPSVSDKTIVQFLDTAEAVTKIRDMGLRANAAGILQAQVGLWQICSRQGALPAREADAALSGILAGFAAARNERDVFDAGRNGVSVLLKATAAPADAKPHQYLVDLLAGVAKRGDEAHNQIVDEMLRVLEAQRIVSLDSILALADHLDALGKGEKLNTALINRISSRVSEIQPPRAGLTGVERNALAFGYWTERHIEAQRRMNLRGAIERSAGDPQKLRDVRGMLLPLLRDTLVAYNYAHYAPPGAQVLYTNPVFVRGHDFLGVQGSNHTWRATELFGTGWPANGGGRLVGSLSGLAYALAEAEQNFLIPSQTQALIWGDLVPQMMLSAKIPRWWNVTPAQMHWVGLHMRYGRSLVAESALDPALRAEVIEAFGRHAPPARRVEVDRLVAAGDVSAALERVTPAEMYSMAVDLAGKRQEDTPITREIRRLAKESAGQVSPAAISRAFGTPKPTLANSYRPELLNLRTFPTLMGYSSRIMAESWESNTLFWASLADELHLAPAQLNIRIPEWTQKVVERIFASHLEDWPAVLRSLRMVGDNVRTTMRQQANMEQQAALE
jgi:hypothetical protein